MSTIKTNNSKAKTFVAKTLESLLVIGYIIFEELFWNILAKPIYQYFKSLIAIRQEMKQLIQQYFGEAGFLASIKSHYLIFKPYITSLLKR